MRPLQVLLVDDDPVWHSIGELICKDYRCQGTFAFTLAKAREVMRNIKIDVLIFDLGFPPDEQMALALPTDVTELDTFLAFLGNNGQCMKILIWTGSTDRQNTKLIEKTLAAARHSVRVFKKGETMDQLFESFADLTGRQAKERPGTTKPPGLSILSAFLALLAALATACSVYFVAPRFLSTQNGPQFVTAVTWTVSFFSFLFALLLFSNMGLLSKAQVYALFQQGLESLKSFSSGEKARPALERKRGEKKVSGGGDHTPPRNVK